MDILQLVQKRATEVIQGLGHLRGGRNSVQPGVKCEEFSSVCEYLVGGSSLYTYYTDRKRWSQILLSGAQGQEVMGTH